MTGIDAVLVDREAGKESEEQAAWLPETFGTRIENTLCDAVGKATAGRCPPVLAAALRYAVFPGGSRFRPTLCVAVAGACGESDPELADAAATAIELLHCASLVHDDLSCFDNADLRRGSAALHRKFGESLGLLTGDGLIVLAFQILASVGCRHSEKICAVMEEVARAVGTVEGIVAGQAWEFETNVDVREYHRAKTGSLFVAAAACGAVSAGADPVEWAALGGLIGAAYQIGDDIADLISNSEDTGKSSQIDARMGRPNMALSVGLDESMDRLTSLLDSALACVPACAHRQAFRNWLTEVTQNTMMTRLGLKNIKRCRN